MPKFAKKNFRNQSPAKTGLSEESDTSSTSNKSFKRSTDKNNFEVLRGLRDGQRYTNRPEDFNAELLLKTTFGYKKKVCLLTEGNLKIYRRSKHIPLGRVHFIVDLGLSVVSYNEFSKCISVNADEEVYRFKAKDIYNFHHWIDNLRKHRLYKQDQLCYGTPSTHHDSMSLQELVPGIPLRGPQLEEFNKFNQTCNEETKEKRVLEWLTKNQQLELQEEDFRELISGLPKLKTLFFELNTLLIELEKLTDAVSERKLSYEPSSPKVEGRKKSKFVLPFRSKKDKDNEENVSSISNLMVPSSLTAFSASNPEMTQVGVNLSAGPVMKGNSTSQLRREISDLYHRETYLKEEYLRVAKETYRGLEDLFRRIQKQEQLSDTRKEEKTVLQVPAMRTHSVPAIVTQNATPSIEYPPTDLFQYQTARDECHIEKGVKTNVAANTLSPTSRLQAKGSSASDESDLESDSEFHDDFQHFEYDGTLSLSSPEKLLFKNEEKTLRHHLPVQMVQCNFSMWSVLKQAIGKDLSKISFPIEMFEPLSVLQVLCEELEYSELLDQAAQLIDPYLRMAYVSAFVVSRYASTVTRAQRKPFNPLEGETYENYREDLGWWFVAEQVSHHPAISACHAKGRGWEFWQSASCNIVYWGKSIQAEPTSPVHVNLLNFQETYQWNKALSSVHNLFTGTRYIEHHGEVVVKCSSGVTSKMFFKRTTDANKHEVFGHVYDSIGHVKHSLCGKWSSFFNIGSQTIWKANDFPPNASEQFGFSNFAVTLNELTEYAKQTLPMTDSRFRPDQRSLEDGNLEEARKLKLQLETNQRNRRKAASCKPKWFDEDAAVNHKLKHYKFNNRYWPARNQGFSQENFELLW